jgi:hypothetical protein
MIQNTLTTPSVNKCFIFYNIIVKCKELKYNISLQNTTPIIIYLINLIMMINLPYVLLSLLLPCK